MSDVRLREFLKEGNIIRTKLCENPNWVTNIVYAIDDEFIEIDIGLEKDYIDNIIMIGDTMKCKYTTDNNEYTVIGWVTRINNAQQPQSLTIRVHQIEVFDNKRDSYRYDVYLSAAVKANRRDSKGVFAILTNVSRTGAAFVVSKDVEDMLKINNDSGQDKHIFVEVYINTDTLFSFEGVIMRKYSRERGIEYGVKFVDMEIDSEKTLNDLLIELANKDKEFYNKRSGFWSKNSKFNQTNSRL
ncbi:MAG: PilZ domain-containing protein [Clostridia bacterium]|nr:PilZ domain-containing protein [Clostridia bacterium]